MPPSTEEIPGDNRALPGSLLSGAVGILGEVTTDDGATAGPSPIELLDGSFQRITQVQVRPRQPPGNEWHFALGVLFALTTTGQLDDATAARYDELIQAEAVRLRAL